jgi:hypothetical protein
MAAPRPVDVRPGTGVRAAGGRFGAARRIIE